MNALYRLRSASPFSRTRLLSITLLFLSSFASASGLPGKALPAPLHASRPSLSATALFERDDAARAERLARLELTRHPHDVEALFVAMEAARVQDDQARELHHAIALCKAGREDDPRLQAAALRIASFGVNSETLRHEREAVEELTATSACADAARETLYEAALDGLPRSDVRAAANQAGWITRWSITRVAATARPAEDFEFPDARIQLPDYFPRASQYSAEAAFFLPVSGTYLIAGDVKGAKLAIDGNDTSFGPSELQPGTHRFRLTFSGSDSRLRIRVTLQSASSIDWTRSKLLPLENLYLHALLAFSDDRLAEANDLVNASRLRSTEIGKRLIEDATNPASSDAQFESASAHPSCGNLHAALSAASAPNAMAEQLRDCAPASLAYAQWLAGVSRHSDAIQELGRVLHTWPLDRDAHRMLISELQRSGNNVAADRAAADFLTVAPNARNFRRMAQNASAAEAEIPTTPFYEHYRRAAPTTIADWRSSAPAVILLQDKVAITRPDGSVSLYMHRVVQLMNAEGADQFRALSVPEGAQLLTARVVNNAHLLPSALQAGDEVEEEYVVNYTGDGGMIAHPEAFQYVFNDFDFPLLDARFVVLSPSNQSPGYVIASGPVPDASVEYADAMRAQIWEKSVEVSAANAAAPAIIRVVENENGWSIPPSVERKRILETIHPGPRPREA